MIGSLYARSLRDGDPLDVVDPDGRRTAVPVERWRGPLHPGDESLLSRCHRPTLDIGCGPGRLTAALRARGVAALGIDVERAAVVLARRAGAPARQCSVFAAVPAAGSWATTLLADGNIGIGGDPVTLLRRTSELLAPGGSALVEVEGPEGRSGPVELRLASGRRLGPPFPWARLALPDVAAVATNAGLRVVETWEDSERWFVALRNG